MKKPSMSIGQQWCQQVLEQRRVVAIVRAEAKAKIEDANAADSRKLAKLADEIATLDAGLDPENLDAIQLLAAKRDQLARLKIKFAADAANRHVDVDNDPRIPAVTVDYSFSRLLNDAEAKLRAAFRPFFRNYGGAERMANDSDGGCVLRRLQMHPVGETERGEILYAIANGQNPPWKFS